MRKLFLLLFAVCLTVAVSAQQDPAKYARQSTDLENKRVGGTLSEDQMKKIYDMYFKWVSAEYPSAQAKRTAEGELYQKVKDVFTPRQAELRIEYLDKIKAAREAAKANQ